MQLGPCAGIKQGFSYLCKLKHVHEPSGSAWLGLNVLGSAQAGQAAMAETNQ